MAACLPGRSDEGVSPVIGTVLLVAITIVVAGVMFAIAQGLGASSDAPGQLIFTTNDAQDRAIVKRTQGDPVWDDVEVRMDRPGGWAVNGPPATGRVADEWWPAMGAHIRPGDYLDVCVDSPGGRLIVKLRHEDPTLGVTTLTFTNVRGC